MTAICASPRAPPPPSAKRKGLHAPACRGELPAFGGERPHQFGLGRGECAGRGAVAHASGDALHDRGEAEEIIGEINRQMRPRIEAGARHVGIDIGLQATECRARQDRSPTSEPVPASECGMCHCIR